MIPDSLVASDLYSMHSFLLAHGDTTDKTLAAENALRGASREPWKEKYNDLRKAMISSGIRAEGNQDEESISPQG